MKKGILLTVTMLLLMGCTATKTYYEKTTDVNKLAKMVQGQNVIKPKFADAENVRYRNVYLNTYSVDGKWNNVTCGEVIAAAPGAVYENFERFISAGTTATSYVESEFLTQAEFNEHWDLMCK